MGESPPIGMNRIARIGTTSAPTGECGGGGNSRLIGIHNKQHGIDRGTAVSETPHCWRRVGGPLGAESQVWRAASGVGTLLAVAVPSVGVRPRRLSRLCCEESDVGPGLSRRLEGFSPSARLRGLVSGRESPHSARRPRLVRESLVAGPAPKPHDSGTPIWSMTKRPFSLRHFT